MLIPNNLVSEFKFYFLGGKFAFKILKNSYKFSRDSEMKNKCIFMIYT